MLEISDDRFRPEVTKIGQKIFSTQNNRQSVSDDNMDPWKRFLAQKAPRTWQRMNVLFKNYLIPKTEINLKLEP